MTARLTLAAIYCGVFLSVMTEGKKETNYAMYYEMSLQTWLGNNKCNIILQCFEYTGVHCHC